MTRSARSSMTFIEIVFVISIIGILVGLAAYSVTKQGDSTKRIKALAEMSVIARVLSQYKAFHGDYPVCVQSRLDYVDSGYEWDLLKRALARGDFSSGLKTSVSLGTYTWHFYARPPDRIDRLFADYVLYDLLSGRRTSRSISDIEDDGNPVSDPIDEAARYKNFLKGEGLTFSEPNDQGHRAILDPWSRPYIYVYKSGAAIEAAAATPPDTSKWRETSNYYLSSLGIELGDNQLQYMHAPREILLREKDVSTWRGPAVVKISQKIGEVTQETTKSITVTPTDYSSGIFIYSSTELGGPVDLSRSISPIGGYFPIPIKGRLLRRPFTLVEYTDPRIGTLGNFSRR